MENKNVYFGSISLRKEHSLRVFENEVLRKSLEDKRDETAGLRRKLHNDELYALHSLSDIIRNLERRVIEISGSPI